MECLNCKTKLVECVKFCPQCGKKVEPLEIKKDIGEQVIEELERLFDTLSKKAKDEKEKKYPCPHCNKELTIEQLKSNLNDELNENKVQSSNGTLKVENE